MTDGSRVVDVERVPEEGSFLFTVRDVDSGGEHEVVLVRADGDGGSGSETVGGAAESDGAGSDDAGSDDAEPTVRGWHNHCQHLTHVRLDKGGGAPMRDDEIVCTNHGAMFDADSGLCTFGPCEGAYLDPVSVTVADGAVYLTDDDYDLVGTGGTDRDDADLTSTSNVEF